MPAVCEETINHLIALARKEISTLITGSHGIGKTMIANYIGEVLKLRVKYLSCSTIDPWVDFTGVPVPNVKKRCLEFFRPSDLDLAELLLLDEINRTHPKVQNAMLETVQFKSINGVPFKSLKMVWAMQNPPGGKYQVSPLDPAMTTRFKARITLTASPSAEYFTKRCRIPKSVAEALVAWWTLDLSDELRDIVCPRTLEALGTLMRDELDWQFALGEELEAEGVPMIGLKTRLGNTQMNRYEGLTLRHMLKRTRTYVAKAKSDIDFNIHCINECLRCRGTVNYEAADIINHLRDDFQMKLLSDPAWIKKMIAAWLRMGALDQSELPAQELHNKVKAMENTFATV